MKLTAQLRMGDSIIAAEPVCRAGEITNDLTEHFLKGSHNIGNRADSVLMSILSRNRELRSNRMIVNLNAVLIMSNRPSDRFYQAHSHDHSRMPEVQDT